MSIRLILDAVHRVYVFTTASETRLLDFDAVRGDCNALAGKLARSDLTIGSDEVGTRLAFEKYRKCLSLVAKAGWTDLWFDTRTPVAVRQALQSAKATGRQVRIFYGDAVTGLDCLERVGVVGWLSGTRVDGLPRAALSEKQGAPAGHRVYELDIVRIVDVDACVDAYRHANYHLPNLEVLEALTGPHQLRADGIALFDCDHKATLTKWLRFFMGSTHETPQLLPMFHAD